jgi:hypothetical protein
VPVGYYNTIAIIKNRNDVLKSVNFDIPDVFGTNSEMTMLTENINDAKNKSYGNWIYNGYSTNGDLLYYPAASACFAYEPDSGTFDLNDKFKKHKWFLPSCGELARILYYVYHSTDRNNSIASTSPKNDSIYTIENGYKHDDIANLFSNLFEKGVIHVNNFVPQNGSKYYWSSSEYDYKYALRLSAYNGGSSNGSGEVNALDKGAYTNIYVIPICSF